LLERRRPSPASSGSSGHGSLCPAVPLRGSSRWSSTRLFRAASRFPSTFTGARTSYRSCSRAAGDSSWDRTSSTQSQATWSTSRATCGTRSGTPRTTGTSPRDHSPAGFEQLFVELVDLLETDPGNVEATAALGAKYGVESDPDATARVVAEHDLIERLA
jgi:hypothetical protein